MLGFPRQSLCPSPEHLIKKFWMLNGSVKGVYVAVFPEHLKEYSLFNKFYFDIDNEEDLQGAYTDSVKIGNFFNKYFNCIPRRYFSGGKGYAIYLDLQDFGRFEDYPIVHLRLAQWIREETKVESIDSTSLGDIARISRVPFNLHYTTKWLCIPTHPDWTYKEIMSNAMEYNGDYQVTFDRADPKSEGIKRLKYFDETAEEYRESIKKKMGTGFKGDMDLNLIMNKAKDLKGFRAVLIYRIIVPQIMSTGGNGEEVHKFCSEFITKSGDIYNYRWEKFVNYYIFFNENKDWRPQSSEKLFLEHPDLLEVLMK
jgi:hypothetical protein